MPKRSIAPKPIPNIQRSGDEEIRRLYRDAKVRTYLTEADLRMINALDSRRDEREAEQERIRRFLPPKAR